MTPFWDKIYRFCTWYLKSSLRNQVKTCTIMFNYCLDPAYFQVSWFCEVSAAQNILFQHVSSQKTTTLWWRESSLQLANLKCRRFLYFITKNVEFCQDTFLYCKNDSYFAENPRLFLNFHESHNLDFPIEFFVFLKKNWKIFQIFVLKIFCKRSTLRKSENSSFSTFFCYKKCDLSNTVNVSMRFLRNLRNKHSRNYSQNL